MPESTSGAHEGLKSHKRRPENRKQKLDPFLELSDDVIKQTTQPSTPSPDENNDSPSLFTDLVLTPLSVFSFIISLFVVERQHRQWRYSHQAQPSQVSDGGWIAGAEPYQDARGTTWHPRLSWKRRGIAEMQISQVLEMKYRVTLSIVVWMALGGLICVYSARLLYSWAFT